MRQPESTAYRAAELSDVPVIVDFKLAMFEEAGLSHLLAANARQIIAADYHSMYELGQATHFLAIDSPGRSVVACAGAFLKSDLPHRYFSPPFYGFMGDVYTHPQVRGQGIARALSGQAIAWLRDRGARSIRLLATPAARPIYETLGFTPTSEMELLVPASPS